MMLLNYRSDHIVPWTWDSRQKAHVMPHIHPELPPLHSFQLTAQSPQPAPSSPPATISRSSPLTCKESTLAGCCPCPQAVPAQAASICPSAEFQQRSMTAQIHNLLVPFCRVFSFILSLSQASLVPRPQSTPSKGLQVFERSLNEDNSSQVRGKISNERFWNILHWEKNIHIPLSSTLESIHHPSYTHLPKCIGKSHFAL